MQNTKTTRISKWKLHKPNRNSHKLTQKCRISSYFLHQFSCVLIRGNCKATPHTFLSDFPVGELQPSALIKHFSCQANSIRYFFITEPFSHLSPYYRRERLTLKGFYFLHFSGGFSFLFCCITVISQKSFFCEIFGSYGSLGFRFWHHTSKRDVSLRSLGCKKKEVQ